MRWSLKQFRAKAVDFYKVVNLFADGDALEKDDPLPIDEPGPCLGQVF